MRRWLVLVSALMSAWNIVQRARKDMFLKRLQMARTALSQAVFHAEVRLSRSRPSTHLRRTTRDVSKFATSSADGELQWERPLRKSSMH